jgi:hypothetical protein
MPRLLSLSASRWKYGSSLPRQPHPDRPSICRAHCRCRCRLSLAIFSLFGCHWPMSRFHRGTGTWSKQNIRIQVPSPSLRCLLRANKNPQDPARSKAQNRTAMAHAYLLAPSKCSMSSVLLRTGFFRYGAGRVPSLTVRLKTLTGNKRAWNGRDRRGLALVCTFALVLPTPKASFGASDLVASAARCSFYTKQPKLLLLAPPSSANC